MHSDMTKGGMVLKNKIISALLCIALFISSAGTIVMASHTSSPMELLSSLDVLNGDPDGNMRPNDLVTRAEFAKMAVLLSPYKTQVALNSKISVFSDCTAGHWAAPYVKTAAENGIIEGYSNGFFGPNDYITYAQAVTVALRLLGYTDEDFGFTYPEGQLGMALSLKLNTNVYKSSDEALTRHEVSQIFTNALTTKNKNSSSDYISTLGYSIVEDCIIVASNNENASVPIGKVYTSGGEYTMADGFDISLIGQKGSAVTTKDGKIITLFTGGVTAGKYAVYSATSSLVSIYSGGSVQTLDCSDDTVVYNGTQKTTFGTIRSNLSTGDLITIGKAADGNIEYIIAGESDFDGPYTVGADATLPQHISADGISVVRNGAKSQLTDIKEHDIIYYSAALGTVFAYGKKVSGTYSAATPNADSPQSITVGGVTYTIESPLAFSKLCSGSNISLGDNVVLLLGRDGGVADVMGEGDSDAADIDSRLVSSERTSVLPELALLSALEAITIADGTLANGETFVTRGEFAKMAVMSSPYRSKVSLGSKLSVFPDCTASYWATPYVKTSTENGLMAAYANGYFGPNDGVTYADALNTALKILGYTDSDFTDWPSSRISAAATIGISAGISKTAYEQITKSEAALILYNTLCSTLKSGNSKAIEAIGYGYYDNTVLIATSNENSSVSYGKILTSNGTFSIDEAVFDCSFVGKSGEVLTLSGKLVMFNPKPSYYAEAVIYSAVAGGLAIMGDDGIESISVSDNTATYANGAKSTFSKIKNSISMGDTATIYFDLSKRLEYIFVDTDSLAGPYVAKGSSDWYTSVSGANASSKIMKNGKEVSVVSVGDILYYSSSIDMVFAYDEKVIGIFEDASPNIDSPDTVIVSGTSYKLNSANALPEGIDYGDTLTLCLGRDGTVVHSYAAGAGSLGGYLIATGIKEFTNSNDETYTSRYARLVLADGSAIDCATDSDYSNWINSIMDITFSDGKAKLSARSSSSGIYGTVNASKLTIGTHKLSPNVKILDVGYTGNLYPSLYTSVFLSRIDGVTIAAKNVLYFKTENGEITELILSNVTGDAFAYGVVTQANNGSFTCDINGSSYSYNGSGYNNIKKGAVVQIALSGNRIEQLVKLSPQTATIKECDYTSITLSNGSKLLLADDVVVYKLVGNSTYTLRPLSELYENLDTYSYSSIYTDAAESKGGRVRIITLK